MIRAVIFDLGGVVIRFTNDAYYSHLAEISGKSHRHVKNVIERVLLPEMERDQLSLRDFEGGVAARLGIDRRRVEWCGYFRRKATLNYDVLDLVKELRSDYIVAFLSNVDRGRYAYTARLLDMDLFDYKFKSCYIGERKPSISVYRYVLRKMGVKPAEAVFIDDRLENVIGARRAGLRAIHFRNRRLLDRKLAELGL